MTEKQLLNNLNRTAKYIGNTHISTSHLDKEPMYKNPSYPYKQNKHGNSSEVKVTDAYKSLVKITAITLTAIIVLHGSYFFAFNTSRDIFNRTETQLSDVTKAMENSVFEDYDCKTVTGTQIQSVYKMLEGKNYSIMVNSKFYKGMSSYETPLGINYNALADIAGSSDIVEGHYQCNDFTFKSGTYNLDSEDSCKLQNVARSASAFDSRLIKDSTGEVVGISFEQKESKIKANLTKDSTGEIVGVSVEQK